MMAVEVSRLRSITAAESGFARKARPISEKLSPGHTTAIFSLTPLWVHRMFTNIFMQMAAGRVVHVTDKTGTIPTF